jgi:hypothetical protein
MTGGTGMVLNSETQNPESGVKITLKCADEKIHSFKILKLIETTTNNKGEYTFSTSDVFECEVIFVIPKKDHFISTGILDKRYNNYDHKEIPKVLYMTPTEEANMVRIRFHEAISHATSDSAKSSYIYIYSEYISAKFYAKEPRELEYLKSLFCSRLNEIYRNLESNDVEELRGLRAGFPPQPIDHDMHVKPLCGGD